MWDNRRYNKLNIFYKIIIKLDNKFYKKKSKKSKKAYYRSKLGKIF